MAEVTDIDLLRDYALTDSEAAFSALVERHIRLVYSAALRQLGNTHQAEEVTQAVFIILARKAVVFPGGTPLSGWLYQTTRLTTANLLRSEMRRLRREQEAHMQSEIYELPANPAWQGLAPLLEEAMGRLSAKERNAIVVRYFEGRSFSEAAIALSSNEAAVQKRVGRGVEKLRAFFTKRGIKISAGLLVALISANSLQSAPAGLNISVTASAVAKGAAASHSTLTLIKGALKIMAWTKVKTAVVVGVVALLATGTATITVRVVEAKRDEGTQIQVLEIIETNSFNYLGDNPELEKIRAMGPKAFPTLASLIEWRENLLDRQYDRAWPFLPSALKKRLKPASVRQHMHEKAVQIVYELGPAAIRPLNSPLCRALNDSSRQVTTYAMRALYWSIPESTNSVKAVNNWLSDPTHQHLFGTTESDDLWPDLPQTVPSLAECLRNPDLAHEAARALGIIGTNAMEAIPALIEVCDRGVAGPPLELNHALNYSSPGEPELMNRNAAFDALGKIGDTSPKVIAAIERGLNDKDEPIRFAALQTLPALHQPLAGRLVPELNTFSARRSYNFQTIIEWTGSLGPDGHEALPWLQQFTISNQIQHFRGGDNKVNGEFPIEPDAFRFSAIVAICKINPQSTRQYLPDLIGAIGSRWEEVEVLTNSTASNPGIVAGLEPLLDDTNRLRSTIAAYLILAWEPAHPRALSTLRDSVAQGTLNNRLVAAEWLWQRTGETKDLLQTCREALASTESYPGQSATQFLQKMGQDARPDVPALKAALWHKDRYVRERAGKALRKIAPDEMPPIH